MGPKLSFGIIECLSPCQSGVSPWHRLAYVEFGVSIISSVNTCAISLCEDLLKRHPRTLTRLISMPFGL